MSRILKHGWIKDAHDPRDQKAHKQELLKLTTPLPAAADLRPKMPAVYDQGQLGSCTANAIAGALHYDLIIQGKAHPFAPSRLAIYYFERLMEGTVNEDSGAQIRDGAKVINKRGFFPETMWPYDISKFTTRPPAAALTEGLKEKVTNYASVKQDARAIKSILAGGRPIVFGFSVGTSFESRTVAQTGIWKPVAGEEIIGGHAVLMVGYDAEGNAIVRNSWSDSWGLKGYFKVSLDWLCNPDNANDFWVFYSVP